MQNNQYDTPFDPKEKEELKKELDIVSERQEKNCGLCSSVLSQCKGKKDCSHKCPCHW